MHRLFCVYFKSGTQSLDFYAIALSAHNVLSLH